MSHHCVCDGEELALGRESEDELFRLGRKFSLASLLLGYPGDRFARDLGSMARELDDVIADVPELGAEAELDDLRSEYIGLFDRGGATAYESEYGHHKGLSKGRDLADVMAFYTAFGFGLGECHEMPDHVAVELEFYGHLVQKEARLGELGDTVGVEIVRDAAGKFLQAHLGGFIAALARAPAVANSAWYGPLLRELVRWTNAESARLGVALFERAPSEPEPEEMNCATLGTPAAGPSSSLKVLNDA